MINNSTPFSKTSGDNFLNCHIHITGIFAAESVIYREINDIYQISSDTVSFKDFLPN